MNNLFFLYIDPGTGSMLFSLFIGLATATIFAARSFWLKFKYILSVGKTKKEKDTKTIPFVIFSDHKRYWNVFGPIYTEFEKHKTELTYYTASPDDPVFLHNYNFIHPVFLGYGNKPYFKMNMLHADIVLSSTPGLDVYQWKRSRYVKWYVHIPHAVRSLYCYRMFGIDHYDAVLANSNAQAATGKEIEDLRPTITKKEYSVVGSPIMDGMLQKKENTPPFPKNKQKVVLIAPSWGRSGILTKFGEAFLSAIQKTDFEIIVRPHPQSTVSEKSLLTSLENKFPDVKWNYDNDNFDILNKADILISDFSGTIFDFVLIFKKPIIYADVELDTAPYDSAWLKDTMWELKTLPRIGIKLEEKNFDKIDIIIKQALENKSLQENIEAVCNEYWENIGHSAEACYNYLIKKQAIL